MIEELDFDDDVMPVKKLTGIHYDLSNEDYHADPSLSKSGIDAIAISPDYYKNHEHIDKPHFAKGTAIHCAILEPDFLLERYFAIPQTLNLRTSLDKAKLEEFKANNPGKKILSKEDMEMCLAIRNNIMRHKYASLYLSGGVAEMSVFTKLHGVDVRCRPDYTNGSVVIDLKSTVSATYSKVKSTSKKWSYDVQDAFYTDVMKSDGIDIDYFKFIFVEKIKPWGVAIFELSDETKQRGRDKYLIHLDTYKRCLDSNIWPSYQEETQILEF